MSKLFVLRPQRWWLGLLAVLALAGCGSTSTTTTKTVTTTRRAPGRPVVGLRRAAPAAVAAACPNQLPNGMDGGRMGCSVLAPPPTSQLLTASVPRGSLFPDVSSWQGNVNWDAVIGWEKARGYKPAAIFKMGEYRTDPFAARNAAELHRLHAFAAGYWFIRNTGCAHEAQQIIDEAHALAIDLVEEDDEVSEARGYDACLTPIIRRAGLTVNEYTSPGSYPGGNGGPGNLTWIAAFGPSFPPRSPWGAPVIAWQFTDGQFGPVVSIPGIGTDDVNVDYTLLEQGAPPPDPYAFLLKARIRLAHGVIASEYNTTKIWDRAKCHNGSNRAVCRSSRYHLLLLSDRVYYLATHTANRRHVAHPPRWGAPNKQIPYGPRYAAMRTRTTR